MIDLMPDVEPVIEMVSAMDHEDLKINQLEDKDIQEILEDPKTEVMTAYVKGRAIGFSGIHDLGTMAQTPLYLKPEYRGKGLGGYLIGAIEFEVYIRNFPFALHAIPEWNGRMLHVSKREGYTFWKKENGVIMRIKAMGG